MGLVYFWNFPLNIFEPRVTKASESEAMDKEAEGQTSLLLSLRCRLLGFELDAKPSVPGKPPTCQASQSLHEEKEEDARWRAGQGPGGDHLVGQGGNGTLGQRLRGLSRGFLRPSRCQGRTGKAPDPGQAPASFRSHGRVL